jgi:aminotransferase
MRSALEADGLVRRLSGISHKARQAVVSPIKEMALLSEKIPDSASLGWGVPSFRTPTHICEAASRYVLEDSAAGKYPNIRGLPQLRNAIAERMREAWNAFFDPDTEILVTVGAQQALFSALLTIIDPGDEVLLVSPGYSSHIEQTLLMGATPVYLQLSLEDGWQLRAHQVEAALTPKTKALILNYPANPTGAVFDLVELQRIATLAIERQFFIIFDATYHYLCYEGCQLFNFFQIPDLKDYLVGCFSFSKEYAMTGWRVGYLCAEKGLVEEILKIHDASVVTAPRVSQAAALAALRGPQDCVVEFCNILQRRRDLMCHRLDRLGGTFEYTKPDGSYYIFPRLVDASLDSFEFALRLLREARVVTIPGDAFGPYGRGHLRLCYAMADSEITEAFDRLEKYLGY